MAITILGFVLPVRFVYPYHPHYEVLKELTRQQVNYLRCNSSLERRKNGPVRSLLSRIGFGLQGWPLCSSYLKHVNLMNVLLLSMNTIHLLNTCRSWASLCLAVFTGNFPKKCLFDKWAFSYVHR